jgi:hypothetical protein
MNGNLTRRLEIAANIAIILVAILICGVLVKTYLLNDAAPSPPEQASLAGTKVNVPEVDWRRNGRTLVLVLQKGCRFCTESAPFYQRLVQDAAQSGGVRLVAVFPHEVEEGRQYLREINVPVEELRQVKMQELGLRGTPSLVLVNGEGVVTDLWFGKLPPDKEEEVLNRLKS